MVPAWLTQGAINAVAPDPGTQPNEANQQSEEIAIHQAELVTSAGQDMANHLRDTIAAEVFDQIARTVNPVIKAGFKRPGRNRHLIKSVFECPQRMGAYCYHPEIPATVPCTAPGNGTCLSVGRTEPFPAACPLEIYPTNPAKRMVQKRDRR